MKLVFAHDHFFLKCGDQYYSGNFSTDVIQRYINVFDEITFVTRGKDIATVNGSMKPSNISGAYFVRVPNFKSLTRLYKYFEANRIIRDNVKRAEYVIARTSTIGSIAIRYAKRYKKPYLVEVVGCSWDSTWNYSILGKILAPYVYFRQKKNVKDAPFVIYVTNEFLQRRYPTKGKSTNISNVFIKNLDESILLKRLEKIANKRDHKLIIGTTAAVNVRYKGQQYVIEALGQLKKQGITHFEYQLVGGGDQNYLKKIANKWGVSENIKFLGQLPHHQIFEWLDTIDIYVQPSRQEGLPRALIEAMSRGLPAFGARTGGIPELLQEKFIFSNKRKNYHEICSILLSFSKDTMIEQAKRNFAEAKKYEHELLEEKRKNFFLQFKESKIKE